MSKIKAIHNKGENPDGIKELLRQVTEDINDPETCVGSAMFILVDKNGKIHDGWYTDRMRYVLLGSLEVFKRDFLEIEVEPRGE